jgi:hypothetical protein
MMTKAFITLAILSTTSRADPSCAYIKAQPQYMHPGVPQAAAEAKCQGDCAQPGYNCEMIANYYPTICTCGSSPSTPSPTPAPPAPAPGTCANPVYHQCGGDDGFSGDTCCPFYQGVQQICHRESDQYWQCCPPDLRGCGAAFWDPYKNPEAVQPAVAAPQKVVNVSSTPVEATSTNECLTRVNHYRQQHGLTSLSSNDGKNSCTKAQAANDAVKGPHNARNTGHPRCGEKGQTECTINKGCTTCIDMYYKEGPGGVHYNTMLNPNQISMSWGMVATAKNQHFFTQNFYQ